MAEDLECQKDSKERPLPKEDKTFEEILARLEVITKLLEAGELPLAEALAIFEEGVGLAARAQALLSAAEGKVELLTKGELKPFKGAVGERGPRPPDALER